MTTEATGRTLKSAEVVVVGAGPVGLFAAVLLDMAGVTVHVVERLPEPAGLPKATMLHPRTLELLTPLRGEDGRSLAEVLISLGRPARGAYFGALSEPLDLSSLDTPYPYPLTVTQDIVERVLGDYVRARGIPVLRGQEVTGFEQDNDAVRVVTGDGIHECRYLIAADGAWSLIRQQAGIGFPGSFSSIVTFLADVELSDPPTAGHNSWHHERGSLFLIPLLGGVHRVVCTLPEHTRLTPEQVAEQRRETPTLERIRALMLQIAGQDFGLRSAVWTSTVGNATRHADRYRVGRVLLAGDAAHVHFPGGGQGVNTGLQDSANLAWKLAAEVKGTATPLIVDGAASYESERLPVAQIVAENTLAQAQLTTDFTPAGSAMRDLMSRLLRHPETARHLAEIVSGLGYAYTRPDATHPLEGHRAPDLQLSDGSLLTRLRPDRFLLADFTDAGELAPLSGPAVEVARAKPWQGLAAALIRPDGYIAQAWPAVDVRDIRQGIANWTTG